MTNNPNMQILQQLEAIVEAARERRAENITVLDLREVSSSLDYFIICSATAGLQINAVHDNIQEKALIAGLERPIVEGPSERWLLLAFGNIVVHIMTSDAREFYDLEGLWSDAAELQFPEADTSQSSAKTSANA